MNFKISSFFIVLGLFSIFIGSLIFPPFDAQASITEKDLQVAARTFNFIDGVEPGPVNISIIYDEATPASKVEAQKMQKIMGKGLVAGKHTLIPVLVNLAGLDQINSKVAYISSGLQKHYDAIFAVTSKKRIFTLTKDFTCLKAQRCIMAIETLPSVKIEVSSTAATDSHLAFGKALTMMIKMKK